MTDPSRRRLADSRLYLCTDGRRERGDLVEFLDAALSGGVDVVQLREKGLEAREELALLEVFRAVCDRHGALLSVNDRADVAYAARAAGFGPDVLHLGQDDLPVPVARAILGEEIVIGRSTHSADEATAASTEPGVDYYCCGPTWPTPTKPGRPRAGSPPLLTHAAAPARRSARGSPSAASTWAPSTRSWPGARPASSWSAPFAGSATADPCRKPARAQRPWFAIGGIDLGTLDEIWPRRSARRHRARDHRGRRPESGGQEFSSRLRDHETV